MRTLLLGALALAAGKTVAQGETTADWQMPERLAAASAEAGIAPPHGLRIGASFADSLPILVALADSMAVERAVYYETDVLWHREKAAEGGVAHWYAEEIGDRQRFMLVRLKDRDRDYTIEMRFCGASDGVARGGFQLFSIEIWATGTMAEEGWEPLSFFAPIGAFPRNRTWLDSRGRLSRTGGTGEQDHRGETPRDTPLTHSFRAWLGADGAYEAWEEHVTDARRCGTGTGDQRTDLEEPFRLN